MRQVGIYIKFTKIEEREIFAYYYECRSKATMNSHQRNLDYVKDNLIEGDNDLTLNVWDIFLDTIVELKVDFGRISKIIKPHPTDPGKGASYRIPSKHTNKMGYLMAISRRKKWRESFRLAFAPIYGIDPNVDKVCEPRSKLRVVESGVS